MSTATRATEVTVLASAFQAKNGYEPLVKSCYWVGKDGSVCLVDGDHAPGSGAGKLVGRKPAGKTVNKRKSNNWKKTIALKDISRPLQEDFFVVAPARLLGSMLSCDKVTKCSEVVVDNRGAIRKYCEECCATDGEGSSSDSDSDSDASPSKKRAGANKGGAAAAKKAKKAKSCDSDSD